MVILSRSSLIFFCVAALVVCVAVFAVYYVYLSPNGYMAKRNSDLHRATDEQEEAHYTNLDGETVTIADHNGELLIVNIWASWSPYTPQDHTVLEEVKQQYGDRVSIKALNRKETKETAKVYLDLIGKREGIEYVLDTTDYFFTSLGGYAMPETFIFDRVGNTRFHKRGTLTSVEITAEIKAIFESAP